MSIRIQFLGAAGTVTGSRFLVETDRARVLVDCGLFQGPAELRERNWRRLRVGRLDAVVLTHGHLDHCGWLPRLVRDGWKGPVWCTPGTKDLAPIVLRDAAWLAEEDARRHAKRGAGEFAPLYTVDDADDAIELLRAHPVGEAREIAPGVTLRFRRAGHILGSATVELVVDDAGTTKTLVFTGDLGRYGAPLMADPEPVLRADVLVTESTYGDRTHPEKTPEDEVVRVVKAAIERKGVLLIPAFAIARTQELLYVLRVLEDKGALPKLDVYVDSPMATDVTALLKDHTDDLDPEVGEMIRSGAWPLAHDGRRIHYTRTPDESKALNGVVGPAIIVSAAGMATGGRILHHLRHRLPDPTTTVCFVGYMAQGTLGRRIQDGAPEVRIHGQTVKVMAALDRIDVMSAHADKNELMRWFSGFERPPGRTFVVHGEPESSASLADALRQRGWPVDVPADGEAFAL